MNQEISFKDICIVSCGVLKPEIDKLREDGFCDAKKVLFTAPGLHEWPWELEKQLPRQLEKARKYSDKIIVLYGERCFMDSKDPSRITDTLIQEVSPGAVRINARLCADMLADEQQRNTLAAGSRVYWLTPGWIARWEFIFKDWDEGKANEMFPGYDSAVVLDALGYYEKMMTESPEEVLRISDWMKIPLESAAIPLDRLKNLLKESARKLFHE